MIEAKKQALIVAKLVKLRKEQLSEYLASLKELDHSVFNYRIKPSWLDQLRKRPGILQNLLRLSPTLIDRAFLHGLIKFENEDIKSELRSQVVELKKAKALLERFKEAL